MWAAVVAQVLLEFMVIGYSEISLLALCTLSSTRIGGSLGAGGGALTMVHSTSGFVALGVAVGVLVLGGPLLLFLLFVLYWVLQSPDLVVVDQAYPVRVVKGFAGVAESEVCGDNSFGSILALEGCNFEGIDPDVMLASGGGLYSSTTGRGRGMWISHIVMVSSEVG